MCKNYKRRNNKTMSRFKRTLSTRVQRHKTVCKVSSVLDRMLAEGYHSFNEIRFDW